jgi:5S rRNA maturation endonuclease (ribonuclease M5)
MSGPISPEVDRFLSHLQGVRKNGANWSARCPCRYDDDNPSLSIGQGNDGRVLVTCHRGTPCSLDTICESVGLKIADLMPPKDERETAQRVEEWKRAQQNAKKREAPVSTPKKKQKLDLVDTYDYTDLDGNLLFQKLRFVDENGKKTFRQRRPVGDGWEYNLDGVDQVLYNLIEVADAVARGETIVVVEGEKDVETLRSLGKVATTMPGGAGKWRPEHTETLSGATVVVISDNDEVGKTHALTVRDALTEAGANVKVLIPDGVKDVTDLIEAGGSIKELRPYDPDLDIPEPDDPFQPALNKIEKIFERDDISISSKITRANMILSELGPETQARPTGRLVKWSDFVEEDIDESYDWIIPDLLERGERVMVVAAEGVGKTMLGRQVALLTASGIHPFTFEQMKPIRTLMVDLENPQRIIRRTSSDIQRKALHYGFCQDPQAHLLIKPDGLDLLKSQDRTYLEEAIEEIRPDLLLLGPVYKSFVDPGGRTSEAIAIEIAKYFDSLREWFKCAMWFEHHAPLGSTMSTRDLRPFGSAVWSRWPEFGLSLTPDPTAHEGYVYDVNHFRGARDQRKFPLKMTRGRTFPFEVLEFAKVD